MILSTPAAPNKSMGWADPGYDIGCFSRAAFDRDPEWMKCLQVPVCGQSISYSDLAIKITAVTGTETTYRQCGVEEFEARTENSEDTRKELGASVTGWKL